ncbi:MAG: hypothetical protein A2V96_01775 [Candidatus Yonathbacteria bacterium RBG_16_43_6]|uniref:TrbC/VIRB2 family protein n=2 Tax=Parcubacteria group TaxID=1794811 RepID=A0A1G2SE49_9BACT|nr:MAG: hypothetical protein UW78_C0005G0035 [Candidatus Azambacteria bacterium GW2011_GWA1_44_9]OHA78366.1 MAG: hypothetical protein A2V96_01775 [Candidatus Yonathbacteria bacterium RBG_16_43_6]OHA79068.1 MAG: hypothetical protein A2658_01915 [Candidatus Yonathbacteria bacterium RIFCSPHIGHO2_01_FULL_44_19]OHA83088.1 MAG: hypothetical protein A3B07_00855 [Candidatus Yonathbacteria bacterium RIFCSPLOWO2_01_FULL_43_27]
MKKILVSLITFCAVSVPGSFVFAEVLKNPIKYNTFSAFVAAVTKTAVQVLMPFVVLAFIYAGFLFVKAQGNDKTLGEAKKAMTWSVVGALILFGAWGFAEMIGKTVETFTK